MQEGTVRWFSESKHYGFIESNGQDFFVHGSDVDGSSPLRQGDSVEFEPAESDRGRKATKVKIKEES